MIVFRAMLPTIKVSSLQCFETIKSYIYIIPETDTTAE